MRRTILIDTDGDVWIETAPGSGLFICIDDAAMASYLVGGTVPMNFTEVKIHYGPLQSL